MRDLRIEGLRDWGIMLECWNEKKVGKFTPLNWGPRWGVQLGWEGRIKHYAGMLGCWNWGIGGLKDGEAVSRKVSASVVRERRNLWWKELGFIA